MQEQMSVGIFFIHGLFGSPKEFNDVANYFSKKGYLTHQCTLPAHGDEPIERFSAVNIKTLIQSVQLQFEAFSKQCDETVIVGHSLGSVLSLLIASQNPNYLKSVCVLSCPLNQASYTTPFFYFQLRPKQILRGLLYLHHGFTTGFKKPAVSLFSLFQCFTDGKIILNQLKNALQLIKCPVFLCHSMPDLVVPHSQMEKIAQELTHSSYVETLTLYHSGHQILPQSKDKSLVIDYIARAILV